MNDEADRSARSRRAEIVDRERPFRYEELFFSTTDPKGIIRTGNEVFVRISAYPADELIGKPHNVIRHPHMPRVVFRLLWRTIEAGEPIAAYVKNRAKDGAYYWVLATVRPIDGGYLSVRLKPSTRWFEAIQGIYAELVELEQGIERAGGTRTEAMDAGEARLGELLAAAGFADYTAFMRAALVEEVVARRALVGDCGAGDRGAGDGAPIRTATRRLRSHLADELARIDSYGELNRELAARSGDLFGFADEGKVLAINAVLAAGRLGSDGAVLAAVAELMKQTFPIVAEQSLSVVRRVEATRAHLAEVGFAVALAALQNDTAAAYVDEILAADGPSHDDPAVALDAAAMLARCLRDDVEQMGATLEAIDRGLGEIEHSAVELERHLDTLAAIERSGRIEATRTERAASFVTLFEHARSRMATARAQTAAIAELSTTAGTRSATTETLLADVTALDSALGSVALIPAG